MRLEVTRKSNLALLALRVLGETDVRVKGPDLAVRVGSTPGFIAQVLNPLVRAGWVRSDPGPTGGYVLTGDLASISVLAVIEAIEGPTDSGACVLGDGPCSELGQCAMHVPWSRARTELLRELESVSVAEAAVCDQILPNEVHVALGD